MITGVADSTFEPILIENLQVKLLKEDERGKMYILRNPNNSQYIKMHESVLNILKIFDGKKSIADISQAMKKAKVPLDAYELVKLLAEEGFIKNVTLPKRKERGDIFSFKIKFFTLTARHMAFLKKFFFFARSQLFKIFYVAFFAIGFCLFIHNFPQIFSVIVNLMSPESPLLPIVISAIIFYLIELAHELAHAISYYHYGGGSSETGIEFHFLIPFFYTSTPDAAWMETRKQIIIFIVGPLTSLFFAEVFTLLFIFEPTFRSIWAAHSFFWHVSTLLTLSPIIRTDGYFIVQALTKFPNLLEHGVGILANVLKVLIRKISVDDFKEYISQYSSHERKVLKFYLPLFPVITGILMFVFVFFSLQFSIIQVLYMTPQILARTAQGVKPYVLWGLYVSSIIFNFIGITGTLMNVMRGRKDEKRS